MTTCCDKCKGIGYFDEGHENDDGTMSGGNYVECDKCGENHPAKICTSDEWLANATQSVRDLANKIKKSRTIAIDEGLLNATKADQYKRMFEAASAELGYINMALDLDPDDGGGVPIIEAIADLHTKIQTQATAISTMHDALKEIAAVHPYDTSSMFFVVAKAKDAIQKATGEAA